MEKLITRSDGSPFATEIAARSAVTRNRLEEFNIVPYNGGYAIEVKEEIQMESSAQVAPETAPAPPVEIPAEPVKHRVTAPWKPARKLDIPEHLKNPAFVYR